MYVDFSARSPRVAPVSWIYPPKLTARVPFWALGAVDGTSCLHQADCPQHGGVALWGIHQSPRLGTCLRPPPPSPLDASHPARQGSTSPLTLSMVRRRRSGWS